ncbi:MAG: class I SAM-dependent methyltransferase [Pyrinomonadaceae bacterium]
MMESKVQEFWQNNPCGAELVGDLNDQTRAEYESFFGRYDEYRYAKEGHILRRLDAIDLTGKRVLEIGLGQGADGEQLVRRGAIYSGVDLTEEATSRTRMRFTLKDLPFEQIEQASALALPFDDGSFDIVFSHGVLHHIPEISQAQREIARVLKPGGRLVAMLYAKWSLNYLLSIAVVRRLGLAAIYAFGLRPGGIYDAHLENVKNVGLAGYLSMNNFINVSTDGPHNPYSKVYDVAEVERDFSDFEIVETRKEFMHAPPLPVSWMPLAGMLGWHLWVQMRPRRSSE